MLFENAITEYLLGKKFSNGLKIKVADKEDQIVSRFDKLIELCSAKNILHLGFADHLPLIHDKINNKRWLHGLLCETAQSCVGIDVNGEAITYIREKFGIGQLFKHDIINDEPLSIITQQKWDYLIIGEVLEHIDNPVAFLRAIKERYGRNIAKTVITVPNAFDLQNIKLLKQNVEYINTDHRYWFTPYTLAKVCTEAGYTVNDFVFCQSYMPDSFRDRILLKRRPIMREGILMVIS